VKMFKSSTRPEIAGKAVPDRLLLNRFCGSNLPGASKRADWYCHNWNYPACLLRCPACFSVSKLFYSENNHAERSRPFPTSRRLDQAIFRLIRMASISSAGSGAIFPLLRKIPFRYWGQFVMPPGYAFCSSCDLNSFVLVAG